MITYNLSVTHAQATVIERSLTAWKKALEFTARASQATEDERQAALDEIDVVDEVLSEFRGASRS